MEGVSNGALAESMVVFRVGGWSNHAYLMFVREVMGRPLPYTARDQVAVNGWSVEMLGEFKSLVESTDGRKADDKAWVLRHQDDAITLVHILSGYAQISTASPDETRSWRLCEEVAAQIRQFERRVNVTPITFWAWDAAPQRPRPTRRNVRTQRWDDVAMNYAQTAANGMEKLLALDSCPDEKMILLHGPSGTGKTHAIRALAREWNPWCDVAYIADPEEFIGGKNSYSPIYLFEVAKFNAGHSAGDAEQRSKLVVLEDAGELMGGEARNEAGQALSRLLNVTDGLLGEGLNIMMLITTNEPLSTLHPAVVRPGRCLAEIEFGPLSTDHANDWLQHHDIDTSVERPTTLAELYAISAGHIQRHVRADSDEGRSSG